MKYLTTCTCLLLLLFAESNSQSSATSSSQTFLLSDDTSIYMPATTSFYDTSELYGSGDEPESSTTGATSFRVEPSSTVMTSSVSTSSIFPSETTMTFSPSDTLSTLTPTSQFTSFPTSSPLDSSSTQFTQSFSFSTQSTQSFSTSTAMSAAETGQQMDVAITLASPSVEQRGAFEAEILNGLLEYYRRQMGAQTNLKSLVIGTIKYLNRTDTAGQTSDIVTVNYTVFLDNTNEARGEFAEAHGELATSEHFFALGAKQTVIETSLLGETYYRDSRSGVTGFRAISCNVFEQLINGCPSDTECELEDDTTRCVSRFRDYQQLNISITLESPAIEQREAFEADILSGLQEYYRRQMGAQTHLKSVVIGNIKYWNYTNAAGEIRNRVTVNYTVLLDNTDEARGEFAEAHGELITSEHFTALGVKQTVIETKLLGETYYRDSRSGVTGLRDISCNIFEQSINECPDGEECEVEDDTARCVRRLEAVSDNWSLKVGLGVGIPLFALLCGLTCCCCCYICLARRRRRRPVERDDDSSIKSVFILRMIPTRFYTVGRNWPIFGSYYAETRPPPSVAWPNPETWSVSDSEVSVEDLDEREENSAHHVTIGFQPFQQERRNSP